MQSQYDAPYQAAAPALEYVGVGRRFLAVLVDFIILGIVFGILSFVFRGSTVGTVLESVIGIAYLIVLEATQGATIGKKVLGLRVVRLDGTPIGWGESIIRNLLRIVDGIGAYLLGAILIWTSPTKQRLGDRVAKTVVVRSR
jgi:uncharacterized RDD family membrane protein YckC